MSLDNIFFIFLSKWVTIQFNFKFSKIKQDFFFKWDYLFQKNSYLDKILTKSAGLLILYYLQIKFKPKIPMSSTYIIQFYKGRKVKRVHSFKTMVNETL